MMLETKNNIKQWVSRNMHNLFGFVVFVAFCAYRFMDVIDRQVDFKACAIDCIFMGFITVGIWTNYYMSGKCKGKESADFIKVKNSCSTVVNEIIKTNKLNCMDNYCKQFIEKELDNARQQYLNYAGITLKLFKDKYMNLNTKAILKMPEPKITTSEQNIDKELGLTRRQKIAVLKAKRLKPGRLTSDMLMQEQNAQRRWKLGKSESQKTIEDIFTKSTKYVLISIVSAYYGLQLIENPTWGQVGTILVQALPLFWGALMGYNAGFTAIKGSLLNRYNRRLTRLCSFAEENGVAITEKVKNDNINYGTDYGTKSIKTNKKQTK